jgi:hypothetical protein
VSLFHGRWARRVSLLAAGALEGSQRAATLAHVDGCAACRADLTAVRDVVGLLERDPARGEEPPLPLGLLLARVQARLAEGDAAGRPRAARWTKALVPLGAAAAAAVVALATLRSSATRTPVPETPAPPPQAAVAEEALRRLEASVARENAVRYLSDAQDVLVTVAATPLACERKRRHVDVGEEARRSRELLARRALLVETDRAEMAGARPVLEDVSDMLREVAALEACSRPEALLAIQRQMSRQRLLMKIDLMTRELQG